MNGELFIVPQKTDIVADIRCDQWRWAARALYIMATTGLSTIPDILDLMPMGYLTTSPSAFHRTIIALEKHKLITRKMVRIGRGNYHTIINLTDLGTELCNYYEWDPFESEWERLVRLHSAETQQRHAASILAFAHQARIRGWDVSVMPYVNERSVIPDLEISKHSFILYVEVEIVGGGKRNRKRKWRNLFNFQRHVAVCVPTPARRAKVVAECKEGHLEGRATDLETLMKEERDGQLGDLWKEKWAW